MIIKTNYDSLTSLCNLMNLTVTSRQVQEDLKVMNLFVKDNKLYSISTDAQLLCLDTLDATYDLEGETNPFIGLRIKEVMDILSKFASLQRTVVKEIVLQTQQRGIVMTVVEEPKVLKDKANFEFSDMYKNQESRFKLTRVDVRPAIMKELVTMVMPEDYIEVKSIDLKKYLDYMYPPMTKPKVTPIMQFHNDFVYSVMNNIYGEAMPNKLPKEIFTGLSIPVFYVNFLRNVVDTEDTFKIYKETKVQKLSTNDEDGASVTNVTLIMQFGSKLVKLQLRDMTGEYSIDLFKPVIANTVEIDKPYFLDTLKRIEGFDQVFVEIDIKEDETVVGKSTGEFIVKTQRTRQRIPVKVAHGSGSFKFMLSPSSLGMLVFSHLTKDIEGNTDKVQDLIFGLDNSPNNMVNVSCMDKTDDWVARYPRAPYKEAPELDF